MKKKSKQARRGRPAGHKLSAESKKKIALAHTGKKHTEETKAKISQSVIDYWLKKDGLKEE